MEEEITILNKGETMDKKYLKRKDEYFEARLAEELDDVSFSFGGMQARDELIGEIQEETPQSVIDQWEKEIHKILANRKTRRSGGGLYNTRFPSRTFKCMVIRHTDTDNEQTGHEGLNLDEIVDTVDGRRGGNYLTVYKTVGFENITPATLQYKADAEKWAKLAYKREQELKNL